MNMLKKQLSMLFVLVAIICSFANVSEAGISMNDFANRYPDGSRAGGDCFWLATRYVQDVCDKNAIRDGVAFYNPSEIRAGDVIHITGHWFIVTGRNGNRLATIDGNWPGNNYVSHSSSRYTIENGTLTSQNMRKKGRRFIEGYHFSQSGNTVNRYVGKPNGLQISTDKKSYALNDNIRFTFRANNASNIYIPIDINDKRADWQEVTGRGNLVYRANRAGKYGFFLHAKNENGEVSGEYKVIYVYDSLPRNLNITTNKTLYNAGEMIVFNFSADNAEEVFLPIDYNGKRESFYNVTGKKSFSIKATKPGVYGFYLHSKNPCGEISGKYMEIKVVDNSAKNGGRLLGDVDGDGTLTMWDLKTLMDYVKGRNVTIVKENSDINGDGKINILDCRALSEIINS